jgi:hypothetical protein
MKDSGMMIKDTALGMNNLQMETNTLVNTNMESAMEVDSMFGRQAKIMMVNLRKETNMAMAFGITLEEMSMSANGKTTTHMGLESMFGQTVIFMKVNGSRV